MATYKGIQIPPGMQGAELQAFMASIDMSQGSAPVSNTSSLPPLDTPKGQSGTINRNLGTAPVSSAPMLDTPKGQAGTINRNTNTLTSSPTSAGGFGLGGFKQQPKQSSLLDFANSIDQAVNMAQQKRNALSLDMMMPSQGTLMASDFNGILSNLNQASANYSGDLTNRALEAAKGPTYSYGTATDNAGNLYQVQYDENGMMIGQQLLSQAAPQKPLEVSPGASLYDTQTGQQLYTAPTATQINATSGAGSSQTSYSGTGGSGSSGGALTMSSKDQTALKNALNESKYQGPEADGKYVDPTLYLQNYEAWIQAGGSKEEFFRMFPPATYINPANTWLPPEIMNFVPKPKSSSSSSSLDDDINNAF